MFVVENRFFLKYRRFLAITNCDSEDERTRRRTASAGRIPRSPPERICMQTAAPSPTPSHPESIMLSPAPRLYPPPAAKGRSSWGRDFFLIII